jgi:hypothetical protein
MNSTQFTYETPNVVPSGIAQFTYETPNVVSPGIAQPSNVIDVDEMTMDQLLANSCNPRNSHRLTNRRLNIALNPEAMQDLVEEIARKATATETNELPYLVYSNGLLLTPEGEVATLEEYNLSTAEIDRQLLLQLNQTGMEDPDECIISLTTAATSAYTTPTKKTDTPLEMPVLRRSNNDNENVRSNLGMEPMRLFE